MSTQRIALTIGALALAAMGLVVAEAHAQTGYRQSGNTTYGSDGSSARTSGNTTTTPPPAQAVEFH